MKKKAPIAIVGMSGIFPGACNLELFWQNIINKVDSTGQVPASRWIVEPDAMYDPNPVPDKAFSKRACLVTDFVFDPQGFNLDKDFLAELDPLFHMVLQAGKQALADSNLSVLNPSALNPSALNRERIGTILAAIALPTDASSSITRKILGAAFERNLFKNETLQDIEPISKGAALGSKVTGLPAALLAEGLGLGGGSYTLDAACASSIYAVKLACDELHSLRADLMLAGGVSRPECLYTQVGFSQLKALSPSGRCAPFDESADGLVVGEGAGMLVLKRLDDALRDNNRIYALIHGTGLSNDMHGNLLAPESEGQVRAMKQAYKSVGWSPADVDYIECHGAGTPVGDRTELQSLRNLWGESGWSEGQCAIGSVKSMTGHLLTGAGAAGMIKTILALQHKVLPPSLKFKRPPQNSPLINSPFRVQTNAEKWVKKQDGTPRRAAVSAFGFGGINAHILLEEWSEPVAKKTITNMGTSKPLLKNKKPGPPIAIIGMDTAFGSIRSLKEFQETIFSGRSVIGKKPDQRWRGSNAVAETLLRGRAGFGAYMDEFSIQLLEFHIPPKEIPEILLQQLIMLKVSAGAMKDARFSSRKDRPEMGAVIGIGFDFEATDFHLRWNLYNEVKKWKRLKFKDLADEDETAWLASLRDACGPPLTPVRTLGALGGVVASRIAKEFCFGGPSYVVSGEETSGLRALEIGVRSLQQHETDTFLVGAIDLSGDIRSIITTDLIQPYSRNQNIHPFDNRADGTLPGEGAAAIILKRLDQAIEDGDRIYSIINGIGGSGGKGIEKGSCPKTTYMRSLEHAFWDAGISPNSISFMETHGSGHPQEDNTESMALHAFFKDRKEACAIGSIKPNIGHTGTAAGLASLVKASLCLYQEIIPPLINYTTPASEIWDAGLFHVPVLGQYWYRNRSDGPRRACVGSMTREGTCMHTVLEGFEVPPTIKIPEQVVTERKRPAGTKPFGLFVVGGDNSESLISGLDELDLHIRDSIGSLQEIEPAARSWYNKNRLMPERKYAISIILSSIEHLEKCIPRAKETVLSKKTARTENGFKISYAPDPLGKTGATAFVYPGSGNHFVGMGRELGLQWPEIIRNYDIRTSRLKTQAVPGCYMPWMTRWEPGWEIEAHKKITSNPLNMIFGQVVHGILVSNLVMSFGINPSAIIGYSLGESAGLFATEAWSDPDEMLMRMQNTNLFTTDLSGPCNAAHKAWNVPENQPIDWCACLINRPADKVLEVMKNSPYVRLLIVNTPDQCVIGGMKPEVKNIIETLGCEAVFLEGVVTVHCDAALPVADAYKRLHLFPTVPPDHITFYSCALGQSYDLTSEAAAASIQKQALEGFDFIKTIEQAYEDGVRLFLEMGPNASCTGMIGDILKTKPHRAISACNRSEDDFLTMLKVLGTLISERVAVDLDPLYGAGSYPGNTMHETNGPAQKILRKAGGDPPRPLLPAITEKPEKQGPGKQLPQGETINADPDLSVMIQQMKKSIEATDNAHNRFLDFSDELGKTIESTFAFQAQLIDDLIEKGDHEALWELAGPGTPGLPDPITDQKPDISGQGLSASPGPSIGFSRDQCMEFAIGSLEKVLGPEFAIIDTYKARVRLPDEPLMLVDRILSVEGEKSSLGSGQVVTEHDVVPGAWYLDGGRAPVCISVEAGQADLFLCSYLGIDHKVKGERTYRLLDATVKFHRGLPIPGETIQYEIEIDKFVKQGETYLFFFNFKGFINNELLITMVDGCAGFFTEKEVINSGGIILTDRETMPDKGKNIAGRQNLVPMEEESYSMDELDCLRKGDLAGCFGPLFKGVQPADSLWLPHGRMRLIDRVLQIDPAGGCCGLGTIRAEADIRPDDWFLTCHFMDDMVMPGTLMYECCAHTLRVFLQRMGWVTQKPGACYEPVIGIESILKCRGPVTPATKQVLYQVDIKEIGYNPEPYVICDAHMFADNRHIVMFQDMSLKMTNVTRTDIESYWEEKRTGSKPDSEIPVSKTELPVKKELFDRESIEQFATGKPSLAFGEPYRIFDDDRFIARLPGPPYLFMDRIVSVEPEPWDLKPGGWVEAEYDVSPEDWYFRSDRSGTMPFCVLLEIPLQTCGWLAAYVGSALSSEKKLKFRNLGGEAALCNSIFPEHQTLTMRARLTNMSKAADMIIEYFDFQVLCKSQMIYEGNTNFGFFTEQALLQQVGLRDTEKTVYIPGRKETESGTTFQFEDIPPLTPDDENLIPATGLSRPSKALRMVDRIVSYVPDGGPWGLGYILGTKTVDPDEWFFKAHFYQDPVCPGSLGIESFLQLIRFIALDRWPGLRKSHTLELVPEKRHSWSYRGQVIPANKQVEIEAYITEVRKSPDPVIMADGFLKVDGLYIYEMKNFGFRLVPIQEP